MENLIQKYLKGKTSREEERKLLDYFMKGYNEMLIGIRKIAKGILDVSEVVGDDFDKMEFKGSVKRWVNL